MLIVERLNPDAHAVHAAFTVGTQKILPCAAADVIGIDLYGEFLHGSKVKATGKC